MKTTPAPRTLLEICRALVLCLAAAALSGAPCNAQEIPSVAGWRMSAKGETPVAHRLCIDLAAPHRGRGSGKIVGTSAEGGARGCFTQEFFGKRFPIRPGTPYRYSVWYRTGPPLAGSGLVLIDSYTRAGETGRRQLIARKLGPAPEWTEVSGDVTVRPAQPSTRKWNQRKGECGPAGGNA